jgi:amino acid permease
VLLSPVSRSLVLFLTLCVILARSTPRFIMDPKTTGTQEPYVVETKSHDAELQPERKHSITGDVFLHDHGAETELRRILSTRHLTMIALGSSIGMGLWLGSGSSLIKGGPAGKHIAQQTMLGTRSTA